jgi:hypothetical protein
MYGTVPKYGTVIHRIAKRTVPYGDPVGKKVSTVLNFTGTRNFFYEASNYGSLIFFSLYLQWQEDKKGDFIVCGLYL